MYHFPALLLLLPEKYSVARWQRQLQQAQYLQCCSFNAHMYGKPDRIMVVHHHPVWSQQWHI